MYVRIAAILSSSFFAVFVIPIAVSAAAISEIMYDLDGGDADREWIEVYNNGAASIDLSQWKFVENDTNHSLTHVQGEVMLASGGYVVIADTTEKFLADHPSYRGALFDSSFSLGNTGELLLLRDENLSDVDSVTYSSEWGANGDGNSLQLISGSFKPSAPTPGAANVLQVIEPDDDTSLSEENTTTSNNSSQASPNSADATAFSTTPQIRADAGKDRTVITGAATEFRGQSFGLKEEPLSGARYVWNFGDGTTDDKQALFHTYHFPGTYAVILTVASGKYSASDKITVTAIESAIEIANADEEKVIITNRSASEIDLSYWIIRSGDVSFMLPQNSIVLPNSTLLLASLVTGVSVADGEAVQLLYPNGSEARSYKPLALETQTARHVSSPPPVIQTPPQASVTQTTVAPPQPVELPTEVVAEEQKRETDAQTAAVLTTGTNGGNGALFAWLFALVTLMSVAIVSVLLIRRRPQTLAEQFEIIEVKDNDT